jgi:hypothetical protein
MKTKRRWWARIGDSKGYGGWVPTPETDLAEARFYLAHSSYSGYTVREWLRL